MTDSPSPSSSIHDQVAIELGAYVLGALEPGEVSRAEQHIQTCGECAAEVAELRAVLEQMPPASSMGILNRERSDEIRARLESMARTSHGSSSQPGLWRALSIAAALALVATGFGYARERARSAELQELYSQRVNEARTLASVVRDKGLQIAAITGPAVTVMELSSTGVNAPTARMFWDRATNRWTVFAHGLARPKAGRAYELWLVTADKKIPAGVFRPGDDGSAVFTATYALRPADLKAIAVTEEPEAGVSAPTGAIVLLGSAAGA